MLFENFQILNEPFMLIFVTTRITTAITNVLVTEQLMKAIAMNFYYNNKRIGHVSHKRNLFNEKQKNCVPSV